MNDKSFYVYDKNIFNENFFIKNTLFNLSRLNKNNIHLYHQFSINNLNCLDSNDYHLDLNKKRIVFIGDSFTSGLDSSYSFFNLLKRKIDHQTEIFNFSKPGTGPSNWILNIETIKSLQPDIIVICLVDNILFRPFIQFFSNDKEDMIFCKYDGFDEVFCKGLIYKNLNFKLSKSEQLSLSQKFLNQISDKKNSPSISLDTNSKLLQKNKEYLDELLNITDKNIIFKFPSFNLFDKREQVLNHDISINQFSNKVTHLIDVYSYMKKFKKENLYLDFHWNLLGNHITSNIINHYLNLF
jgi:hypothetical protein